MPSSPRSAVRARLGRPLVLAREEAEQILADRALDGQEEDVWFRGEVVGTRRRYDNRLLLAHLARLDRAAEAPVARADAARFDEVLARVAGELPPPELLARPDDLLPRDRAGALAHAAEVESLWQDIVVRKHGLQGWINGAAEQAEEAEAAATRIREEAHADIEQPEPTGPRPQPGSDEYYANIRRIRRNRTIRARTQAGTLWDGWRDTAWRLVDAQTGRQASPGTVSDVSTSLPAAPPPDLAPLAVLLASAAPALPPFIAPAPVVPAVASKRAMCSMERGADTPRATMRFTPVRHKAAALR
ncbi:hypothetical protein V5740_06505 [Croceibacterium sp. TMG7-5b_MA50]|uniref:hypothetical protein n=1 Tax=Croceibacterium sp. TMG7-5b_MA50 TaxID=3121290 RepID=UPI003221C179